MDEEVMKGKGKKGLIKKTLERCKSLTGIGKKGSFDGALKKKSKSWPRLDKEAGKIARQKRKVAPEGCFSVYVGPQKQRFVIKTEYVNHPLFKLLLEEAESEYGYNSDGPLALPCDVDYFVKVLVEMDGDDHETHHQGVCSAFVRSPVSYHLLTPPRLVAMNQF